MKRLLLALAVALGLGAGSTALASPSAPEVTVTSGWSWVAPPTPRVAVVGDSLTWQAEHGSTSTTDPYYQRHYLTDRFVAEGWQTRIAAKSGATTGSLRMWGLWTSPPTHIVMALGTNDNYYLPAGVGPEGLTAAKANVRFYLSAPQHRAACVVYVGVVPSVARHIDDTAPAWNDWLRAEAARTGGVYLDWPADVAAHPEYVGPDGLHQTPDGQAAYRERFVAAVKACQ